MTITRRNTEQGMAAGETGASGGLGGLIRRYIGFAPVPMSKRSQQLESRIQGAQVATSVCPYCAVGCSQLVYHRDGKIIDIEGNPDSPINDGHLCPKGAATYQLVNNPNRPTKVLVPRAAQRPLGRAPARLGDGSHRATRQRDARQRLRVER